MSRSYRKNPIRHCRPDKSKRRNKRQASKEARRMDLANGANYKRSFDRHNIWDRTSNMYRIYKRETTPRHFAPLTVERLRFYWNK
jgi:hypothetical protein